MPKFDHHVHTTRYSPDSLIDPDDLIERAREVGLDGVVITEHDAQWDPDELDDLRGRADGLVVLSGVEVSAREGHFLVYGLPDLDDVEPGIALADLIRVVRGREAAIVAAHPFRWGQEFDLILGDHGPVFDALELVSNNITPETRRQTQRVLKAHRSLGATGSSDGHDLEVVGCYYTEFPDPVRSMADFVAMLRRRAGRPGSGRGLPQTSGRV